MNPSLNTLMNLIGGVGIGLMVMLMASLAFTEIHYHSHIDTAQFQMEYLGELLELYHLDTGGYPKTSEGLEALTRRPPKCRNWHGPYDEFWLRLDPWQVPFEYASDGNAFRIRSSGPDRNLGSEDDLCYAKRGSTLPQYVSVSIANAE